MDKDTQGVFEIYFADKADADRFAQAVLATPASGLPGFKAQRAFQFDARAYVAMQEALKKV